MYIIYIVNTVGVGIFKPTESDMCCNPSECLWLVPGTKSWLYPPVDKVKLSYLSDKPLEDTQKARILKLAQQHGWRSQ